MDDSRVKPSFEDRQDGTVDAQKEGYF